MKSEYSENFICIQPMTTPFRIGWIRHQLKKKYGCGIRLRGRHSNRKSVLMSWHAGAQNDIPWYKAERVAFYKRK